MKRATSAVARAIAPHLRAPLGALWRRQRIAKRGTAALPGLSGPVSIRFDRYGIPHVRAGGDGDAFFAQGVCHALDRFFQMDIMRRALSGRLAETLGERPLGARALPPFGVHHTTLDADRFVRALDLLGGARAAWAGASAEERSLLGAYCRGVNAALSGPLRRKRPMEHRLLGLGLEPWRPLDALLMAKGMALGLSLKWRTAPVFAALARRLHEREDLLAELLPPAHPVAPRATLPLVAGTDLPGLPFPPALGQGSNAFLVGRGRSESGGPILASDPHLELSLPGVWYLASLWGARYRAVGATLPGLPGVVIGRTPTLAWGLTNGMADDSDYWVETLDERGERYRVDGEWRALDVRTEVIARRGRTPHLFRMRRTHRGPLVSDAFPHAAATPLSLRMTLHEPTLDLRAFLAFGRAETIQDVDASIRRFGAPVQNVLLADARGNAAFRLMGMIPRRTTGHPALPRDGRRSDADWEGFLEPEEMPARDLAPDEILVSANDARLAGEGTTYISNLYEPSYRAERIRALLEERRGLRGADLARAQMDVTDLCFVRFRRQVLEKLAPEIRRERPHLAPHVDRLLAWNGEETPQDTTAALFHFTLHHLMRRVFGGQLGGELLQGWMVLLNQASEALLRVLEAEDSSWAPASTRPALLVQALGDALGDLAGRGYTAAVAWGDVHSLHLIHPAGGRVLLAPFFDRGPIPYGGSPFTPHSGQYLHDAPARVRIGPSYRQVVDLGAVSQARMITFGGQSGDPSSPHYDDLTALWLKNEGLPMVLEDLPEAVESVLTLVPGG